MIGEADTNLGMWESMEESPCLQLVKLKNEISVSTSRGRSNNVLVEGKWYKRNENEEVDRGRNGAHSFRSRIDVSGQLPPERRATVHLFLTGLAQILPLETGFDEGWTEPSYQ